MASKKHASRVTVTRSLKDLGKALKRKKSAVSPEPPEIQEAAPPSDEQVFRDAMHEVQEIREFRRIPLY